MKLRWMPRARRARRNAPANSRHTAVLVCKVCRRGDAERQCGQPTMQSIRGCYAAFSPMLKWMIIERTAPFVAFA